MKGVSSQRQVVVFAGRGILAFAAQLLAAHHDVGATVGFPERDGHLGDGGFAIGVKELGPVGDDSAGFGEHGTERLVGQNADFDACDLVQDDVLDIALINMEIPNVDKFHTRQLASEPLYYCVCSGHHYEHEQEIRAEMLDGESLILYNQDSVQNRILQAQFSALNIHPRVIMRSSQIPTILKFMRLRSVWAAQYLSAGTLTSPIESCSILYSILLSSPGEKNDLSYHACCTWQSVP